MIRQRMICPAVSPESDRRDALPPPAACSAIGDLTWLAHRAAAALGDAFNAVSRDAELADLRDWPVLELICKGAERTQLEIGDHVEVGDHASLVLVSTRDHARFHAMLWSIVQNY